MIKVKPSHFKWALAGPLVRFLSSRECSPSDVPPNTKLTILPNGIRIASEENKSGLACISLFCEAGSRYEKACNNGIFHFIEHLVYKGFKSMDKCQLQDLLYCSGIKFSAKTDRELQIFSAQCLPECAPIVVDIFSKIICEPAFLESEIELERKNLLLELEDEDNHPKHLVFDYLHRTAFQGTPLAQPVIGPMKNLKTFNAPYCNTIMKDHYQPYKLAFACAGTVNHEDIVQRVNGYLGCMESDPSMQSDEGPCRYSGSQVQFRNDALPFAHVTVAFEAPGYSSNEYWIMFVASCILGAWDRSQGRGETHPFMMAQAGDTGICERYEPFYLPYRDVGLWGVYFVGHKLHVDDMVFNITSSLMSLCMTVQTTDVEVGINRAKLLLARGVQGNINTCHDIGKQIMYRCGRQSLKQCYDCLSTVNYHVLREVCDKYFYNRDPVVAAVGPTEALPDYLRIQTGMYWLRR